MTFDTTLPHFNYAFFFVCFSKSIYPFNMPSFGSGWEVSGRYDNG